MKQFLQLVLEKPDAELDVDHLGEVILDFHLQGILAQ